MTGWTQQIDDIDLIIAGIESVRLDIFSYRIIKKEFHKNKQTYTLEIERYVDRRFYR